MVILIATSFLNGLKINTEKTCSINHQSIHKIEEQKNKAYASSGWSYWCNLYISIHSSDKLIHLHFLLIYGGKFVEKLVNNMLDR